MRTSSAAADPLSRLPGAQPRGQVHGGYPCAVAGTNRSTGPVTVMCTGKRQSRHREYFLGGAGDLHGGGGRGAGDGDLRGDQDGAADLAEDLGGALLPGGGAAALDAGGGQGFLGGRLGD